MTVQEFQTAIVNHVQAWDQQRAVTPTETRTFAHVVEEVGELAREYVSQEERPEKFSKVKLSNAIGDALCQLVYLAHLRGLDVESLIDEIVRTDRPNA